jgi:hypothetical protein
MGTMVVVALLGAVALGAQGHGVAQGDLTPIGEAQVAA